MVSAFASQVLSRRQLIQSLAAAIGVVDPAAMRRPGKAAVQAPAYAASPNLATPPGPVRWLQKATFGYCYSEFAAFAALPGGTDDARWTNWVTAQLNPAAINDSACDARIAAGGFTTLGKTLPQLWSQHHAEVNNYNLRMQPIAEIECATTIRATYSKRQLFEVMTDFWHDHFSTYGWDYDGGPMFVHYDRDVIRPNVFGNFRTMLESVAKSTTMMYYLDLYASTVAGPNENYARELIELHTLGAENYAGVMDPTDPSLPAGVIGDGLTARLKYVDEDVYEATRVLTGWTIKNGHWQFPADNDGTFVFRDSADWHDRFTKYVLNRRFAPDQGQQDGFKLFDLLAAHPGTANFIARKLCRRFVGDDPPAGLVASIAQLFQNTWQAPDQLRQVTQAILLSSEFKNAWGTKIKRPFNALIGALRGTFAEFTPTLATYGTDYPTKDEINLRLQQAGQRKFYWPAPNGYPDRAAAWASSGSLAMTWKMLVRLTEIHREVGYDGARPYVIDILGFTSAAFPAAADRTAANIVGYWCDVILGFRPEPVYTKAVDFLRQNAAPTEALNLNEVWAGGATPNLKNHYTQSRLRSTVALILCSPDALRR